MSARFCGELEEIEMISVLPSNNQAEFNSTPGRKSNDFRLQDIEEQLEMAESKCNNLKDQLDYMKHVYGVNRPTIVTSKKISAAKSSTRTSSGLLENTTSSSDNTSIVLPTNAEKNRQKSSQIGTDSTGAAVRTINNILNGITNSVNRLSEIHSQMTTPRVKVSTGVSPRHDEFSENGVETDPKLESVGIIPEIRLESNSALVAKTKKQTRKSTNPPKTSSQHTVKKPPKVEKKSRSAITKSSARLDKKSSTTMKNRFLSKFHTKNNNIVEIYHNDAIKHSDSDESNLKKSRQTRQRQITETNPEEENVPPLNIQLLQPGGHELPNGFSSQFACEPPHAPRMTVSCCYSKNYELPTVASRMKQVAKSYLGSLSLKTIPFCAAISTTQSHNIGINIQQVMNIIKNRQSINGISPTLAHNIGLAAEKLNNKPFSTLVSTINSKISQTASKCPLSRTHLNIQQLQEQAKSIPEETIEEVDENANDSPETCTMIITGPSGDMEIKTKNMPTWRVDKNTVSDQCTCVVQPSVEFHHIANKYQRNVRTIAENNLHSQVMEHQVKKKLKKFKISKTNQATKTERIQEAQTEPTGINHQQNQKEETLNGREKNLKVVLTNLHHDFDSLNKKYEELTQKGTAAGNDSLANDLEKIEIELNQKEEEIRMVMALYKEVLALKQQIRYLKDKRSLASLPVKDVKDTKIKFKDYNNPEAAFHLTKLLKQIQHYQMRYKTNLSQE